MLKRPPKPVFILLAQREGFVAVYLVRIAGILHAGHARRNHHHFAELVLNDVGIVERRRGCAVKRGRERVVHQSDLELQCPHRFLLSWLYLFYDTTLHQKTANIFISSKSQDGERFAIPEACVQRIFHKKGFRFFSIFLFAEELHSKFFKSLSKKITSRYWNFCRNAL